VNKNHNHSMVNAESAWLTLLFHLHTIHKNNLYL